MLNRWAKFDGIKPVCALLAVGAATQFALANLGGFVSGWYLAPTEVAAFADAVVRGRVTRVTPVFWRDAVWTECEIAVQETWQGAVGKPTLVVRQPGGELDGFKTEAGPRSNFQPGEEWILAVDPIPGSDYYTVIGLIQGAFKVDGEQAKRDFTGLRFSREPPPGTLDDTRGESFPIDLLETVLVVRGDGQNSPPPPSGEQKDTDSVPIRGGESVAGPDPEPVDERSMVARDDTVDLPPGDGERCGPGCVFLRYPIIGIGLFAGLLLAVFFAIRKPQP